MAQSILKHPQAIMSEIRRDYQISDEEEILAFLERYPAVAPLLHETRSNIRRYFGEIQCDWTCSTILNGRRMIPSSL